MINKATIFEIIRLTHLGWSNRQIARHLKIDRITVKRYRQNPNRQFKKPASRSSKLDPYLQLIDQWLDKEPEVKATVVLQRLRSKGFSGQITIVRDLLRKIRGSQNKRQAYTRFESEPGQQMQIDWGHFGSLPYGHTNRKLYALAVLEAYSRMLYVEFTHSQKQQTLHQCLLNAFTFFGGTAREMVVDNMLTAVVERQGSIVRFNDAFLDFLRTFNITPVACTPGAPHEKGKIEAAIKYIRRNFWPLRTFEDLSDIQNQARQWLNNVANPRVHQTTGQRPVERFKDVKLNPLPDLLPDCREVNLLKVHKDFAVRFDGNTYTTPPWTVGKKLTVKANMDTVSIHHRSKIVVVHHRCWQRHCRVENKAHKEQVKKLKKRLWQDRQIAAFASLGVDARLFLQGLIKAGVPIKKSVSRILDLKNEYGAAAVITAIQTALRYNAFGADYIENIVHQKITPQKKHPPVRLKSEDLNRITLNEPSLAEYDAHVIKRRKRDD
jgi:transposase